MPETLGRPGIPSQLESKGFYHTPHKDDGSGLPEIDPADAALNDAINRQIGREFEVNAEMATNPETSADFFEGLRGVEELQEDGNVPKEAQDRWTPSRLHSAMYYNAKALGVSINELLRKGRIEPTKITELIDGKAVVTDGYKPTKPKFASFAISYEPFKAGNVKLGNGFNRDEIDYKYDFGIPTENSNKRLEMALAVKKGITEYQARLILGEHISVRTSLRFRDSLEDLVGIMHSGSVTYFKGDHLKGLFNLPSVRELEGGIKLSDTNKEQVRTRVEEENAKQLSKENRPLTDEQREIVTASIRDPLISKEFENRHEFGDQVEEAIFLNMIMLNSSGKTRMQEFLKRPGVIKLMSRLADKDVSLQNLLNKKDLELMTNEQVMLSKAKQWQLAHIGDVDNWIDDKDRYLENTTVRMKNGVEVKEGGTKVRVKATWREESEIGLRKELTKWANISAWGGNPSEFSADKEIRFIEGAIGDVVGSKEAAWLAATFLRSIGAYASEGYAVLPPKDGGSVKGRFLLPLGEGRYISGDDTGKFYANLFNLKEGLKGRASGLKDMIGRVPDMAMNLFDWAGVEVGNADGTDPEYPLNWDGTMQKRSVWDAWLGTAEQPLRDILTGGDVVEVAKIDGNILNKLSDEDKETVTANKMGFVEVKRKTNNSGKEEVVYKVLDLDTNDRISSGRVLIKGIKNKHGLPLIDKNNQEKMFLWVAEEKGKRLGDLNFKTLEREFHGTFTIMQWLMGNGEGPTGVFVDALKTNFRPEDFEMNELKKKIKYIGIVMNPVVLTKGSQHLYKDAGGAAGVVQNVFFDNLMNARKRSNWFAQNILGNFVKLFNPDGGVTTTSSAMLVDAYITEAKKKSGMESVSDLVKHYIDGNGDMRTIAGEKTNTVVKQVIESASLTDKNIGMIRGKNTY